MLDAEIIPPSFIEVENYSFQGYTLLVAAQVAHASMAFLTTQIRRNAKKVWKYPNYPVWQINPKTGEKRLHPYKRADFGQYAARARAEGKDRFALRPVDPDNPCGWREYCENGYDIYLAGIVIPRDVYEGWIDGAFTKTVCEARNRNHLMKAVTLAEEQNPRRVAFSSLDG